ncbi:ribbon-helix-helix domain-containing protein [Eoetvoesiella caeni]
MAIRNNDRLQRLFPDWTLDDRAINWLWLILQDDGAGFHVDDFGTPGMRDKIAHYIDGYKRLSNKIEDTQSRSFTPEHDLNWIEKSGRQPAWLLKEYLKNRRNHPAPLCPPCLTARQELMALLDYSDATISRKQSTLKNLQAMWVQHQVDDKHFDWYASGGKENEKCKIAWLWYQDNHQRKATHAQEFAKQKDVLTFLDRTDFDLDAKLYHLGQIKKKFKAQQTKANRQGKTQTNLSLSEKAREQLDELAKKGAQTRTELIELLIQNAYEHGMPN